MSKLIKAEQLETQILPPIKTYIDNHSVPNGGTTGQVLTKKSDTAGDVEWADGGGSGATPDLDAVLTKGYTSDKSIILETGDATTTGVSDNSLSPHLINLRSYGNLSAGRVDTGAQLYPDSLAISTTVEKTGSTEKNEGFLVRVRPNLANDRIDTVVSMTDGVKSAFRTALGVKDPYETSTTEHAIGTFMGYPLYEKTIENVTIYNPEGTATFKDYKLANKGIPNNYTIVEYSGSYLGMTDSNVYVMPSPAEGGGTVSVVMPEGTEWMIRNSTNQIVLVRRLTVRYVKENIL